MSQRKVHFRPNSSIVRTNTKSRSIELTKCYNTICFLLNLFYSVSASSKALWHCSASFRKTFIHVIIVYKTVFDSFGILAANAFLHKMSLSRTVYQCVLSRLNGLECKCIVTRSQLDYIDGVRWPSVSSWVGWLTGEVWPWACSLGSRLLHARTSPIDVGNIRIRGV